MLIASFNEFSTYYGAKSNSGLLTERCPAHSRAGEAGLSAVRHGGEYREQRGRNPGIVGALSHGDERRGVLGEGFSGCPLNWGRFRHERTTQRNDNG